MKIKEKKDLKTKSEKELKVMLKDLKDEIFKLKQELSLKKLKNTRQIFQKRKDIARILTILKEKEAKI